MCVKRCHINEGRLQMFTSTLRNLGQPLKETIDKLREDIELNHVKCSAKPEKAGKVE